MSAEQPPPPLRRNRDFSLLWTGQALSSFGQQVSSVAYPLLVLALTGSSVRAGLVGTVGAVCIYIGGVVGGVAVDRYDRRWVIVVSDAARALAMAGVGIAVLDHVASLGLLLASAAINGLFSMPVSEAIGAAVMRVVPIEQTEQSTALNQARSSGAQLAGFGLGGVLYSLGASVPFLLDAVSYLASVGSAVAIRTSLAVSRQPDARRSFLHELGDGVTWLREHRTLTICVTVAAFGNFSLGAGDLVVIVLARHSGASSGEIGVALAIGSAGGIIGAVAAGRAVGLLGRGPAVLAGLWAVGLLMPVLALCRSFASLGLVYAAMIVWLPMVNVVVASKVWRLIPDELRGRVQATLGPLNAGLGSLGPVVAGVVLARFGRGAPVLLTIPCLVTAAIITAVPSLRAFVSEPLSREPDGAA